MPEARKSTRHPSHDYSTPGGYFITVCSHRHRCIFGRIDDGLFVPSNWGSIVNDTWISLPEHFPQVNLNYFQLMPNHIHSIIVLPGEQHELKQPSVSTIIGMLKSSSSKMINKMRKRKEPPIWQRGFYDRVIRPEEDINDYRAYIRDNPMKWQLDRLNPINKKMGRS